MKTYHDGFITVSDSRYAKLLDADCIQVLCSTTLPRSQQLAPDVDGEFTFCSCCCCGRMPASYIHAVIMQCTCLLILVHAGIDCFEGFLVNCLEACCQSETEQFGSGPADSSAINPGLPGVAAPQEISAAPQRRVRLQVAQAAARPALLPKLKRKHDGGFSAPRAMAVPAPTEHAGVLQSDATPCMQQLQRVQQHEQRHIPEMQLPQHRQLQQCTTTEAADSKRKRRRSGLRHIFMPYWVCNRLDCMHASISGDMSAIAKVPQLASGHYM